MNHARCEVHANDDHDDGWSQVFFLRSLHARESDLSPLTNSHLSICSSLIRFYADYNDRAKNAFPPRYVLRYCRLCEWAYDDDHYVAATPPLWPYMRL